MRLGKRERAALREKEAARALALRRQTTPGRYVSMWSRFFPVLRPVGTPKPNWSYRGVHATRIHDKRKVRRIAV